MTAAALVNTEPSFSPRSHRPARRLVYKLRSEAARLLSREAVAQCGRRVVMSDVAIRVQEGRARWCGLQTCGSVWLCPTCAQKVAEERRQEVRQGAEIFARHGGACFMAAFTFSHKRWHKVEELRRDVTAMWSKLIAGKPWQKAKAKARCLGVVRALEVTHGQNGWHPHIHALFFLPDGDDLAAAEFSHWLFDRWDRIVQRAGYAACNPAVWRFERAAHYDAAADYVVKGNFDLELTRGHMKLAKGGGRSPWQLLEDSAAGDKRAGALFRDFAGAFKGARQVTWSYGLRRSLDVDEKSDEEIAAAETPPAEGEIIGHLPARVYARIVFRGYAAYVLEAAEDGGWPAVMMMLRGLGLSWENPYASYDRSTQQIGAGGRGGFNARVA